MLRLTVLAILAYANGYSTEIYPGDRHCFIVPATTGSSCSGSFEVISTLDPSQIKVSVIGPSPKNFVHYTSDSTDIKPEHEDIDDNKYSEGSFSFETDSDGDYTMCIANGSEEENDGEIRTVAFNLKALALGQEDGYEYVGLHSELQALQQGLDFLKDHQSFMNQREDVHAQTLESIKIKLTCWTVLESLILIGMALWQISYIRGFFEVKRRL